jgi:hypothetical protein
MSFLSTTGSLVLVTARCTDVYSEPALSIGLVSQWHVIETVRGCHVEAGNGTSGCTAGTWITLRGSHLTNDNSLQVVDNSMDSSASYNLQLFTLSATHVVAQLPDVPQQLSVRPLGLQLTANSLLSALLCLISRH